MPGRQRPSDLKELLFKPLLEVAALLQNGDISSVELTRAFPKRIASLDGRQKSYTTVMADQPLMQRSRQITSCRRGSIGAFTWDPNHNERSVFYEGDPLNLA